jgi:hypothetical protein
MLLIFYSAPKGFVVCSLLVFNFGIRETYYML